MLQINSGSLTPELAKRLVSICPFGAITLKGAALQIGAACRMCGLCVKQSEGAITLVEEKPMFPPDDTNWNGIAVYADRQGSLLHPVTFELLGKGAELAKISHQPLCAVLLGGSEKMASELLRFGADRVEFYDHPQLEHFLHDLYVTAMTDFVERIRPSCVLVGATDLGRTLAPMVAAKLETGLTADCTQLEIREGGKLVQIRPAFGGNIMAQIVTPRHRPQFCTVRYRVFSARPPLDKPSGIICHAQLPSKKLESSINLIEVIGRPQQVDISDAEVIVAAGRGVSKQNLQLLERLAGRLGAQMACTRPLVENGWFNPRRQIGLSGRTVKPKLLFAAGISGSVQFAAGMQNSDCIVALNLDPNAPIFQIAHHGFVGDLGAILNNLLQRVEGGASHVLSGD